MIVSSLTQLATRIRSVSRESSLAPYSSQTSLGPRNPGPAMAAMIKQKFSDSASGDKEDMNIEEAKKALHASFERIASMVNLVKNSSERELEAVEAEGPLLTSSPVIPQKLDLASEAEEESEKLESLDKHRQNLLLSRPYFLAPNKAKNEYNPSLSTISSHTMMASPEVPHSPNLTSAASHTLVQSEATLIGQTSIETDDEGTLHNNDTTSRTLQHNDTLDNSEMSDFSFEDVTIGE